jgi:Flp pilus assembly protein TadD
VQQEKGKGKAERVRRLLNQGAQLLERGEVRKAIVPLKQALQLDPDNLAGLINLGGAYVMDGQHRKAVVLLERASESEPDNAMVWINLGAACLGNPVLATPERQIRAITAFERALTIDPAAPSVHYNLGLIFVDRGNTELAEAAFQQALRVNPADADARTWLRRLDRAEELHTESS